MIETIPYRWYSDPEQLRREQERVFARSWQYVGRADEVAAPGSFTTGRCGDVPVLVVRDGAGVLRGFLNVCRHRGSTLLEGAGSRRSIQVPLPRVDVRPRRRPARRAAHGTRAGLRPRRALAASRRGRHLGPSRDGAAAGQFRLLYPNTGVNVFPGTPNLSIGPLLPAGPDRTERFLDYFFAEDADPEWIAEFLAYDDRIGREDAAMVESVHRGMRSGLLEREARERALDRLAVDLHRAALAGGRHRLPRSLGGGARQLERVALELDRLVAAAGDPGDQAEVVEQRAHLLRGRLDHPQVARGGLLELPGPGQRPREAVDGRERRPQVVAGERDEPREILVFRDRPPGSVAGEDSIREARDRTA